MEVDVRKRTGDLLRAFSRALPIGEQARATIRAFALRIVPWLLPNRARPGGPPSSVSPRLPNDGAPDYFIWALLDWHFRLQRPQQLALKLAAAGRRVFFISSTLVDSKEPGFRVEPLDDTLRLFQIFLHVSRVPSIYFHLPAAQAESQLRQSLGLLIHWCVPSNPISIVEHPFWWKTARTFPASRLLYDRMDYHQGFGTFAAEMESTERELMAEADLTIVSSDWLDRDSSRYTVRRILIRNAADYEHFSVCPQGVFEDSLHRRVIGYYGAIAGWMDLDLVAAVADRYPDCLILLIGHDQVGATRRLRRKANVRFLGEVPYAELPFYLHRFDVCLLPRRILPLTAAMNPVKLYEYLCAGLPVVSVDLPELQQFGDLVYSARSAEAFLDAVAKALKESPDDPIVARRREFAQEQTWTERAARLIAAAERLPLPHVDLPK